MKKKIVSACAGMLSICMVTVAGITTHAAEISVKGGRESIRIESFISTTDGTSQRKLPLENEAKGLFTTKYRVSVNKATMRSGPGTNYSSLGTLYKNDVVWVRSISDGWAKFKVNSKWHYISESCIKKATY